MSEPIKVLLVIGQLEVGGTERQLLNILPEIEAPPLAITVYALRGGGRLEPAFKAAGIRTISPAHHSRRWLGLIRTTFHLLMTMRAERPQLVHFYLPEAYLVGGLSSLLAPRCIRLMSRRSLNNYQTRWPMIRLLERFLHRRMDAVLANSKAVLAELREEGVPFDRCGIIYNGVGDPAMEDLATADTLRAELGLTPTDIVFIMVANLIPYKGHTDLIAALEIARTRLPHRWAVLLIGADSGLKVTLQEQARVARVEQHLRWLDRQDDPQQFLALADIALSTSREEGFSNAILEAMAIGLPLVATAVGGNAEAVVDGQTGLVVPARNATSLADALVRLATDASLRKKMGAAGRQRVADHFTISRCANAYRRTYLELSSGAGSPISSLDGTGA